MKNEVGAAAVGSLQYSDNSISQQANDPDKFNPIKAILEGLLWLLKQSGGGAQQSNEERASQHLREMSYDLANGRSGSNKSIIGSGGKAGGGGGGNGGHLTLSNGAIAGNTTPKEAGKGNKQAENPNNDGKESDGVFTDPNGPGNNDFADRRIKPVGPIDGGRGGTGAGGGALGVGFAAWVRSLFTRGAVVAASPSTGIALGFQDRLRDFASMLARTTGNTIETWKHWGPGDFKSLFLSKIADAKVKIYFNLDGIPNVWSAVTDGSKGFGVSTSITHWELFTIYNNPQALARTVFYRNGQVVASPLGQ